MRGKKNMHKEIQIKQFPIVTTHWWPKTRNEQFVWENEPHLYRFFTSCTQPCPSDLSAHTHPVCDVCVRALWLMLHSHGASASTLDGGCVWSVVLTQHRGIFLLEDAHCHRSCRLLSCIVFLYERSMYPFHSSVTRRQCLTEGVSEAWCFKKLFELFDSIIIYGYVYSFWYKMMAL